MKRLTNKRKDGGLGFPRMGREPFDLAPGKSVEIDDDRWEELSQSPAVIGFVLDGELEVADVAAQVPVVPERTAPSLAPAGEMLRPARAPGRKHRT